MGKIEVKTLKKIREETGAGIMEVKKALEQAQGNQVQAKKILAKLGREKAAKRQDKEVKAGRICAYIHSGDQVGAMVSLYSETDFVARSEELGRLGKELCLQVASMDPKTPKELLTQAYIRAPEKTVSALINEYSAKFKEKLSVKEFVRFSIK
jgi:elongation factor Ts